MSKATSVLLNLRVNIPIVMNMNTDARVIQPCNFDDTNIGGWEVFVHAIYYNWIRFENGVCNRMFSD
jgi:hypothetical protein